MRGRMFVCSASKLLFNLNHANKSPPMMVLARSSEGAFRHSASEARYRRMSSTNVDITESVRLESEMETHSISELIMANPKYNRLSSPLIIQSQDQLINYMNRHPIHNYLFDCDGVLYRGTDPMPYASRTIQFLINDGKRVFFVTNSASVSRKELKQKLEKILNLPAGLLKQDMMIGSAYAASRYLCAHLPVKENNGARRVHVIGSSGLCNELRSAGFDVSGGPDPIGTKCGMSKDELANYPFLEGSIDALVCGWDPEFSYRKLCIATVLLQRNPNSLLVATNRDPYDLIGVDGRHMP